MRRLMNGSALQSWKWQAIGMSFGTKPLSLTVSDIFNIKCNAMVDVILIRPLNKGQGPSFWYQWMSIVTFALGRTV